MNYYMDIQKKIGKQIDFIFNNYAGNIIYYIQDSKNREIICDDGIVRFFNDLMVDIMDPITLYISYKFCASTMVFKVNNDSFIGIIHKIRVISWYVQFEVNNSTY